MQHVTPAELAGIIALVETVLEVNRERHNPEWCRKKWVGRARERLASKTHVVAIASPLLSADELAGRKWAEEILAKHCRNCGKCELGRE